jgi:hypothetical protein
MPTTLTKTLFFFIVTSVSLFVAGLPEGAMWLLWHFVSPQTELGKIAMVLIFWGGGAVACIVMAIIGFVLWLGGMKALFD